VSERHAEAIAFADRAIDLATALGLPAPARVLGLRGGARFALGDAGGLDDTRRALEAALGQGLGRETAVLYNNLAEDLGRPERPRARLSWRARARPSPSGGGSQNGCSRSAA